MFSKVQNQIYKKQKDVQTRLRQLYFQAPKGKRDESEVTEKKRIAWASTKKPLNLSEQIKMLKK